MKKVVALWLFMLSSINLFAQQDIQISQYLFNSIFINPAYTGYKEDLYVHSYYRSQWVGLPGAPQSFSIAADAALKNANIGLGAMISSDRIGAQSNLSGYLNYAYRIRLDEIEYSHLAFGLAAGVQQLGIDGSKLNALQGGDAAVPIASHTTILPDANVGIYYSTPTHFIGLSATNLLAKYIKTNNVNLFTPIPQPHVYLTAGTLLDVSRNLKVKPVFLLKDDFKAPTVLDLNAMFIFDTGISFGAFYRSAIKLYPKNNIQTNYFKQNAFGGIVEMFVTPSMRIGYSYDQNLNALGAYNYGSHELSIGFYINANRSNDPSVRCYKF